MKTKWKLIWGGLALSVILVFIVFNLSESIETELLEVKPSTIANTFKEEGTIVPQIEQPIYPLINAKIIELPVKEGQKVEEGQVLAVLDTTDLQFQLQQLQGQLTSIQGEQTQTFKDLELQIKQIELDLAAYEKELERIQELYKMGAATKKELEEAERLVRQTALALEQEKETLRLFQEQESSGGTTRFYTGRIEAIEAQIQHLEYQINQGTLTAPSKGTVANLSGKIGEMAKAGVPLMTVFQEDAYQVEVYVLAEDVTFLEKGMKVNLIQDRKGQEITFPGIIREISPTATERLSPLGLEEQRVKVTVDFTSDTNNRVIPGSKLDVEFTTEKMENQLVVPQTALFPYESGSALWVVRQGKARVQPVTEGFATNEYVVIEKGLEAGDLVILNPQLEGLKEGKKIKNIKG